MKHIIYIALFFISTLTFAQEAGSISGKLLDVESNNAPLMFAKVAIKETGAKVMTNAQGVFTFENMANGTYTLVFSFTGYDSKEIITEVTQKPKEIKMALSASSVSLDDFAMVFATSETKDNAVKNN